MGFKLELLTAASLLGLGLLAIAYETFCYWRITRRHHRVTVNDMLFHLRTTQQLAPFLVSMWVADHLPRYVIWGALSRAGRHALVTVEKQGVAFETLSFDDVDVIWGAHAENEPLDEYRRNVRAVLNKPE